MIQGDVRVSAAVDEGAADVVVRQHLQSDSENAAELDVALKILTASVGRRYQGCV